MVNTEQVEKEDFNALVVQCAGPDRKEQEGYIARVIMKVMNEQYGKGGIIPDSLGIPKIETFVQKDLHTAWALLSVIYSCLARSLLGDSCHMLDIRSKARKHMQAELERRQEIKREAGI